MSIRKDDKITKTEILEAFDRDGYVVISGAIDSARLSELRKHFSDVISNPSSENVFKPGLNDFVHDVIPNLPEVKGILMDVFEQDPDLLSLITNNKVLPVLQILLGNDFVVLPDFLVQWNYFNVLHTDMTTAEQRGNDFHKKDNYRVVSIGIYFQENNEHGGGLHVVPGSHKRQDPYVELRQKYSQRKAKLKKSYFKKQLDTLFLRRLARLRKELMYHPEGINIPSKLGDVVIFDNRIIHRSSFPEDLANLGIEGGKMAFMGSCSVNNEHAVNYCNMLNEKKRSNQSRDLEPLKAAAEEFGINIL